MKKIKKLLIVICICFWAICQLNNTIFAYTLEEAKDFIDYKTVAGEGVPDNYDVFIDLSELKNNEQWPCGMRSHIDNILFDNDQNLKLRDINFFNTRATNTDDRWIKIQNFVKLYYHIALYIATAFMMTLLIYAGIVMVLFSITEKHLKIPFEGAAKERKSGTIGENENPYKNIMNKKFIEEWIKSFLLIILMVYIINVIIAISGVMNAVVNDDEEPEENYITVYVANANGVRNPTNSDIDTIDAYYFKTNIEGLLMFQTQYKWDKQPIKNIANMIALFIMNTLKVALESLFIIRMIIVAILTILAPIIVLLNAFKVISGNKGILNKWFKLYLYCVFIKTAIAFVYYTMVKTNPYLVIEHPMYIVLVMILIFTLIVFYIKAMIKSMTRNDNEGVGAN